MPSIPRYDVASIANGPNINGVRIPGFNLLHMLFNFVFRQSRFLFRGNFNFATIYINHGTDSRIRFDVTIIPHWGMASTKKGLEMIFLALTWPILGALWRRAFGGWGGVSRGILELPCVAMAAFPFAWAFTGPIPFWWSVAAGAVFSGLVLLFFVRGFVSGPIDRPTRAQIWKKYGPFGAGYWLAWRYWPASWRVGGFIDGPYAVGELFLGASVYGLIGLLWLA